MSSADMVEYQPLVDALKIPLPETIETRVQLRQMIAYAESFGVVVSTHRRTLLVEVENQTALKLQQLKDGFTYDREGEWVQSEEAATKFSKLNADEKKIILSAEISGISAELEFVTHLEELIKRRCSIGQSILNSMNTEVQSSFNK